MKDKLKVRCWLLVTALALSIILTGCSGKKQTDIEKNTMEALYVAELKEAPIQANPDNAAAAVYTAIEKEQGTCEPVELSRSEFTDITGISEDEAMEVVAFSSSPKDILSDVFIVKPYPSLREDVRDKLFDYKENKMREYENFDILDAYSIAKNSIVYDQGEYLVMLMLTDNEIAQQQVDMYIPQ